MDFVLQRHKLQISRRSLFSSVAIRVCRGEPQTRHLYWVRDFDFMLNVFSLPSPCLLPVPETDSLPGTLVVSSEQFTCKQLRKSKVLQPQLYHTGHSIVNTNTCATSMSLVKVYFKFLKNTPTCFCHSTIIREFFSSSLKSLFSTTFWIFLY